MADVELGNMSSVGLIKDRPAHELPPEAFTTAFNMRVEEGKIVRMGGRTKRFGTLSQAPYFIAPVRGPVAEIYWVYFSLTDAFNIYSATETEITNAGGDYNAVNAYDINYALHGGVPIFNTGNDNLQMWSPVAQSQKLQDLTNWPSGDRCIVIRSYWPHLVALGPTIGGTKYIHGVLWSHPSDPGAVPTSWDYTDPTVDAGLWELPDSEAGQVVDGRGLRGQMMIYKESSTWIMRFIGGRPVFSFQNFLENTGALWTRCVAQTGDGKWHFVVSQDDVFIHNGSTVISLLDGRMRSTIFNALDIASYRQSFCFNNPQKKEMWFCYPETGETSPTRALIWNYGVKSDIGVLTEADVSGLVAANSGVAEIGSSDTWDAEAVLTWASDGAAWDTGDVRRTFVADPGNMKIMRLDDGEDYDGTSFTGTVQREGLTIIGRRRDGSPIVDQAVDKLCHRVWPRATGGPISMRIGAQDILGGTITWSASETFDPSSDLFVDFDGVSGIAIALECSAAVPYTVSGVKLEIVPAGRFG